MRKVPAREFSEYSGSRAVIELTVYDAVQQENSLMIAACCENHEV